MEHTAAYVVTEKNCAAYSLIDKKTKKKIWHYPAYVINILDKEHVPTHVITDRDMWNQGRDMWYIPACTIAEDRHVMYSCIHNNKYMYVACPAYRVTQKRHKAYSCIHNDRDI
jgi:hypothetical protein